MVCTGNICRSTMAQEVLAEEVAAAGLDILVDSAGISDEEHGNPIDPRAARVLREAGHAVPDHRARQVSAGELGSWDLVLAMTRQHLRALHRLASRGGVEVLPDASPGQRGVVDLRMYRSFDPLVQVGQRTDNAGRQGGGDGAAVGTRVSPRGQLSTGDMPATWDVPDPWYGGHEDFVETLEVVERVSPALVDHLRDLRDGSWA